MAKIVECIPNYSEGKDLAKIERIVAPYKNNPKIKLLSVEPDANYNRTVVTVLGDPDEVKKAVIESIGIATKEIDMNVHKGEHKRMGATDVVPFLPIQEMTTEECNEISREVGKAVWEKFKLPVFLYESTATAPNRVSLPDIRKGEYEGMAEKLKQPELNDEFAKELGYASLDELKAKTKEEIIKRENDRIENEYVSALLDKLMETTTIDVPVSMVQAEIQNRLKELEYQLSMQGFKMDDYLKMMGGNIETFAAQLAPAAEKKVKIDLILDKIAKENHFEATDEELSQRMEEVAKMYGMDVPALEEELKKNKNLENFKASLKYDIVMKKAIDEVVKNSKNA
ncbi:hypothetical protein [uncultured Gemella sp.]|uniref:hypothetical protein n=1 Tax=uncultured Gemella sp. TaxID=254352 RepID=UPI0026196471|nr:hypothetical protein [uncultured Gemella sp.]